MNLLDLFVKIGVKDEATERTSHIADGIKNVLKTAAAIGGAAVTAASTAAIKLGSDAVKSYADYEQLTGGVAKLFGTAGQSLEEYAQSVGMTTQEARGKFGELQQAEEQVMRDAENAYKESGLTMNEYMETVTGFSAALIQGLGGDTKAAAELSNTAINDMADNANTFGSSMESIQNAYAGFAKGNFTMLDNLKLGYGGTATEMLRLVNDSGILEKEVKKIDEVSFDQIIQAIHKVQENQHIAGTTAREAAGTISGSTAMMKAAWGNLVTGIADDNADMDSLIGNFIESLGAMAENIIPRVETVLNGVGQLVTKMVPLVQEQLPAFIENVLPGLLDAGTQMLTAVAQGVLTAAPTLLQTATDVIVTLVGFFIENIPMILETGLSIIVELVNGITQALPELIPAAIDAIVEFSMGLIENIDMLIDPALQLIMALAMGLIQALPTLIEKAPEIILALVTAIIEQFPKILETGIQLIEMLIKGIVEAVPQLILKAIEFMTNFINMIATKIKELPMKGREMVEAVKEGFMQKVEEAKEWGQHLIQNFIDGIKQKWEALKESVINIAETVSDYLGFSEPDKGPLSNFHTYAPDMMQLFAQGIRDNAYLVTDEISKQFDFGEKIKGFGEPGSGTPRVVEIHNHIEVGGKEVLEFINDGLGGMY